MAAISNPSVYAITCKVNGRKYIGGAAYPSQRWYEHKSMLRAGKHRNTELQTDWNYYGEHEFQFTIIEEVNAIDLSLREDFHIAHCVNKYNVANGYTGRSSGEYKFVYKDKKSSENPAAYTPAKKAANSRGTNKRQEKLEWTARYFGFENASAMLTAIIKGTATVTKI